MLIHRSGVSVDDTHPGTVGKCEENRVERSIRLGVLRHASAIRNLERAGVSQAVAMKISGHKTASVSRRYRIVDEEDVREALARTHAAMRHAPATVTPLRGTAAGR